jgi:hypothetical protein
MVSGGVNRDWSGSSRRVVFACDVGLDLRSALGGEICEVTCALFGDLRKS